MYIFFLCLQWIWKTTNVQKNKKEIRHFFCFFKIIINAFLCLFEKNENSGFRVHLIVYICLMMLALAKKASKTSMWQIRKKSIKLNVIIKCISIKCNVLFLTTTHPIYSTDIATTIFINIKQYLWTCCSFTSYSFLV